ncbi:MAG TPA: Rieske 2Fe-2S domain-containing protein [Gemmatimonas sp.]|nr:Rieske 2Fe-2S domain-containing protein [Gemmatimonas sp.]
MHLPVHSSVDGKPDTSDAAGPGCDRCESRREFVRDFIAAALGATALSSVAIPAALTAQTQVGPAHGSPAHAAPGIFAPRIVRYPIPAVDGVSIDKKNEVMLCRSGNQLFAFALSCPHQNTALRALGGTAGFQCPKHKSRYKPDGTFISGRATRNMDRLPISRDGDAVAVNVEVAYASDKDAARWTSAVVTL